MRHARTDANDSRELMGQRDVALGGAGRREALALGGALARLDIDSVYSSPLRRARDTAAQIAAPHRLSVQMTADLCEMDFGVAAQRSGRRPKLDVKGAHRRVPLPGGECLLDVWTRATRFAAVVRAEVLLGRSPVVVGHYRVNQLLVGVLAGSDFDDAVDASPHRGANASVYELSFASVGDALCLSGPPRLVWSPGSQPGTRSSAERDLVPI